MPHLAPIAAAVAAAVIVVGVVAARLGGHRLSARLADLDRRVERAIDHRVALVAIASRRRVAAAVDATRVPAAWVTALVDATAASPAVAPDLAAFAAAPLSLPHPIRHTVEALRSPVARAVDRAEHQLGAVFPHGRAARHAARAFVAATTLGAAGLAAAASVLTASVPLPVDARSTAATVAAGHNVATTSAPDQLPASEAGAHEPPVTATVPEPAETEAAPGSAVPRRGAIPIGKGMWIWLPKAVENGDPVAIVSRAKAVGLTHVYVRTGSTKDGFYAQEFLDALLPVAHANGIRVFGWDFPHLDNPGDDVARAWAAITYKTPDGHRIDGFAPDIETPSEGTNNDPGHAGAYGEWLRTAVGPDYPLVAVVPRPSPPMLARGYPYAEVVRHYDAIAPMVYWMDKDPGVEVANAINYLSQFGKPIIPIGQAYDGGIDGGPGGRPSREAIIRFMQVSWQLGAPATSFWSWQHADAPTWDAIRDAGEFRLPAWAPAQLQPQMIRAYQHFLSSLGYAAPPTGVWDPATDAALRSFQRHRGLTETGIVDDATLAALLRPVKPPLPPGVDPT